MKIHSMLVVLALGVATGCSGIKLKSAKPSEFEVPSELKTSLEMVHSTDSTMAAKPQDWLGRVGIVRAVKDQRSGNSSCSKQGKIEWVIDRVGPPSALKFNEVDQNKRLKFKSILDQKYAAKIDAMQYLQGELSGSVVMKVVMTEIAKQRVTPGEEWEAALTRFRDAHKASYFDPTDICYVVVVAGYTYSLLTRERFTKVESKIAGGYAGINVNGNYFSSSEEFALDDVFGLSLEILRRPSVLGIDGGDRGDRNVSSSDAELLQAIDQNSDQKPGAWQPAR